MSMDGLRKGAQSINNKGSKGGGGRKGSAFYAKWKSPQLTLSAGKGEYKSTIKLADFLSPPPSEEAKLQVSEPIVLIKGDYPDIYAMDEAGNRILDARSEGLHLRVHNFNIFVKPKNPGQTGFPTFREIICSSGPEPHAPQPCVGCFQVDHGAKDSKARDNWAFNIAHLAWYHLKPLVKDGAIQMKKDGSGPVLVKEECVSYKMENIALSRAVQNGRVKDQQLIKKAKTCESCKEQHQFVFGNQRILQLGWQHLKNLFEIDDKVGKNCINCGTNILRVGFDCANCNTELLDIASVQWTNDDIERYAKTATQCPSCNHHGLPKSAYECGFDENFNQVAQACENPQRTSIFDCVLWIQREGDGKDSQIVVKRVELIRDYKTQDTRPLSEHLKEIVPEPFDLVEMYKPDSTDVQAEVLQIQNPYAQQPQYSNYPGQPSSPYAAPGGPQSGPTNSPQTVSFPGMPVPGRPNFGK